MTERWRLFGVAGLAATALYVVQLSETVSSLCAVLIGVGTVWAAFTGPSRRRAEPARAWPLMATGALCFLIGLLLRPFVSDLAWPLPLLADIATVPGYALLCAFLITLLRARNSLERHTILDGLIVCLAASVAATMLLAMPAASLPGRPVLQSVLAGLYPLLDVVVLLLVVNLTFTTRTWPPALVGLLGVMTLLFIGDIAYAIIGVTGKLYASPLLDVPFLLSFTLLGMTSLHPSVTELGRATRQPVQAWSGRRIAVLAPALATPFALLLAHEADWREHLLLSIAGAAIVAMLLLRAISAVAAQVAAQRRVEHQLLHDALTGLPNRRMITQKVDRMLARMTPGGTDRVWVFLLDLDGFKLINESWGHETGDLLVVEVGRRLRKAAPEAVPVAALGGDEFLLAYLGDRGGAMRLAERIRGCFQRPWTVRGAELRISTSMGIASTQTEAAAELLRDADTAMYRAKGEGPGRTAVFDASMHDQVRERIELEVALRQALGAGQLHVAYQPIVDIDSGVPVGAEALLRWTHPERGPISPVVFIPIAEDAGLIGEIGTWVRREAIRQLGRWRSDGTVGDDFYLSINVSPHQFGDPELPLVVSAELLTAGVPARCVALEMTESVMVEGSTVTGRVLLELRELGVRLLIDDFGTGFSALGYLRKFPVTGLKIDRSFVIGLGQCPEDHEIVRAIASMSRALGLSVIAEGVETRVQRDALAAAGVPNGQGWLWGPAVPPVEFATHWHAAGTAALSARQRPN